MKRSSRHRSVLRVGILLVGLVTFLAPVACGYIQAIMPAVQVRSAGAPLVEIPFTIVDDHIVLPVSINNSPEIDMLLDTGMPIKGVMLLDDELARDLDLEYSSTVQLGGGGATMPRTAKVSRSARLSFSGFGFPAQQVLVPKDTDFADDWPAAAVLGTTFFDHAVEIDFTGSVIRLYENVDDLPEDPGHQLDLTFTMGIPVIDAAIVGSNEEILPVTLIADTGVNAPLILFPYSDQKIEVPGNAVETSSGVISEGLAGDVMGQIGRVPGLLLGPYHFEEVITAFPTEASMGHANVLGQNGFVGTATFKRFTVVFDYSDKHMYLRPNGRYGERFEWNMAGLLMGINRAGFLQVKDIVEGSPGDKQGIRPDDIIIALNDQDIRDLDSDTIHRLFNEEGARLHLEVQRGSDRFEVTLTLRRIV